MNIFFSKNHKKHKTNFKKSNFFKNEAGYMFGLTYAFSRNFVFFSFFFSESIIQGLGLYHVMATMTRNTVEDNNSP